MIDAEILLDIKEVVLEVNVDKLRRPICQHEARPKSSVRPEY